jgi:hypothetical protein
VALAAATGLTATLLAGGSSPGHAAAQPKPDIVFGERFSMGKARILVASGPAGVFVVRRGADNAPAAIDRLDPKTGAPRLFAPIDGIPVGLRVGDHSLWLYKVSSKNSSDSVLVELDATTAAVLREITIPVTPTCFSSNLIECTPAVTSTDVWVPVGSAIYRVSLQTHAKPVPKFIGAPIAAVESGDGYVWVLADREVIRMSAASKPHPFPFDSDIPQGLQGRHMVVGTRKVWVTAGPNGDAAGPGDLIGISIGSGAVKVVKLDDPSSIALFGGNIWVERGNRPWNLEVHDGETGAALGAPLPLAEDVTWLTASPSGVLAGLYNETTRLRQVALAHRAK